MTLARERQPSSDRRLHLYARPGLRMFASVDQSRMSSTSLAQPPVWAEPGFHLCLPSRNELDSQKSNRSRLMTCCTPGADQAVSTA